MIKKKNMMKRFSFRTFSFILAALCLILASGSCHRRVIAKYGGPPAGYKSMHDAQPTHHETIEKV